MVDLKFTVLYNSSMNKDTGAKMNAYELADEMLDVTDSETSPYHQAGIMLRRLQAENDKVIPQLVKANGIIENLRIRIAELEKQVDELLDYKISYENLDGGKN